jgi:hypothetical protein
MIRVVLGRRMTDDGAPDAIFIGRPAAADENGAHGTPYMICVLPGRRMTACPVRFS